MESDSAPKEAVPLTQLQKGTKRHYLSAEHGTFFEALASFFGENSEEIKRVIMDMKDEADAPPQKRRPGGCAATDARNAARLVRWLVEMADKLPECDLEDEKYGAGRSLIRDDIVMTREQVLVLLANLVLLRLDGKHTFCGRDEIIISPTETTSEEHLAQRSS